MRATSACIDEALSIFYSDKAFPGVLLAYVSVIS